MKLNTLQDLYVEELRDLYNAENQLIKALPKIADEATSDELRSALEDHLDQTKEQIERLDEVFSNLGSASKGKKCVAMEGLIKECEELLKEEMEDSVKDAAIIGACQKIEHYEIASYGTVCTYAKLLDREDDLDLLGQTLDEEKEADENLTDIAESSINFEAAEGEEEEEAPAAKKKSK
ncbi:MAG: ferritin-like domain-containing protein [Verrucomicrobia bacterium]|nr:ferritin-like domain-containing protein [Verrucomicrobiota bacterium]